MISMKRIALAAVGAAAVAATPLASLADPVAQMTPNGAAVAYLPSQFANSPTTTGPSGDAFTLNFDGTGRFLGIGRPQTPRGPYETAPVSGPTIRQARLTNADDERARVDRLFTALRGQLRALK